MLGPIPCANEVQVAGRIMVGEVPPELRYSGFVVKARLGVEFNVSIIM